MQKKIKGVLTGLVYAVTMAFTVFTPAITAWAYVPATVEEAKQLLDERNDNTTATEDGVEMVIGVNDDVVAVREMSDKVFRYTDISTYTGNQIVTVTDKSKGTKTCYVFNDSIANAIIYEQAVESWLNANVRSFITDGMTRDDVIYATTVFLDSYGVYDESIFHSSVAAGQSAWDFLSTRAGLCASISRSFRAIIEYVPFNEAWVVDWNNGQNHISVALVYNPNTDHIWAAIQDPDGTWYHYDTAIMMENRDMIASGKYVVAGGTNMYRMTTSQVRRYADQGGTTSTTWLWYY